MSAVTAVHEEENLGEERSDNVVVRAHACVEFELMVRRCGKRCGRSREAIDAVQADLEALGIHTLEDWSKLSEQEQVNTCIPLYLQEVLAAECRKRRRAAEVADTHSFAYLMTLSDVLHISLSGVTLSYPLSEKDKSPTLATFLQDIEAQLPHLFVPRSASTLTPSSASVLVDCSVHASTSTSAPTSTASSPVASSCTTSSSTTKTDTARSGVYTESEARVLKGTFLAYALQPERFLRFPGASFVLKSAGPFVAVENWLRTLELSQYVHRFYKDALDDYFVLPFLKERDLDSLQITEQAHRERILCSVKDIQSLSSPELVSNWIALLGFAEEAKVFLERNISQHALGHLKDAELVSICPSSQARQRLTEFLVQYQDFSSVEASFNWMQVYGFVKYSLEFVRYNIPFYALPLVNFFIINEMGISSDDRLLFNALKRLQFSPAYNVKAIAYWLRDLEMEEYSLVFASELGVNFIESLPLLTTHKVEELIHDPTHREKMKRAVHDMRDFQFYYSATAALLQEPVVQKYSSHFVNHGISVDVLPLLTAADLAGIGIADQTDLDTIVNIIGKLKEELPKAIWKTGPPTHTAHTLDFRRLGAKQSLQAQRK